MELPEVRCCLQLNVANELDGIVSVIDFFHLCIDCSLLNSLFVHWLQSVEQKSLKKKGAGRRKRYQLKPNPSMSVCRSYIYLSAGRSICLYLSITLATTGTWKNEALVGVFFCQSTPTTGVYTRFTKLRIILVSPYILFRVMVLLLPNIIVSNSSTILEPHIGF